jgi:uncharacterized membrane protein YhaH (DUF805 family)
MLKNISLSQIRKLLFAFSGRINRAKYWLAILIFFIWVIIWICAIALSAFAFPAVGLFYVLAMIAVIPIFVTGIAIGIKRLHDRDKSGWWLILFYVVPSIFEKIGDGFDKAPDESPGSSLGAFLFYLCSFAISVWGLWRSVVSVERPDPINMDPTHCLAASSTYLIDAILPRG